MIYYYKCVKTESVPGFEIGKVYIVNPKKKEFIGDNGRNYYEDIIRYTGEFNPNPSTWSIPWREFKFINNSKCKIVIKQKGNKVIAKYGSRVAEAKCHEDDEFDYYTGCRLALDRLFGKENDIAKNDKKEEDYFGLKKGDIVRVTKPGLAYSTWIDYFQKLHGLGCSDEYIKDLIERYAYGSGLGYDIYTKDKEVYNKIYGDRKYKVEFINKRLNAIIITYEKDGSVYLIDYFGVEKV